MLHAKRHRNRSISDLVFESSRSRIAGKRPQQFPLLLESILMQQLDRSPRNTTLAFMASLNTDCDRATDLALKASKVERLS